MLTRVRLLSVLLSVPLFLLFSQAQVHGVPASVTSYGFGGNISPTPGIPASVTSLGPNGYSFLPAVNGPCCFNSFFPGHQFSSNPRDQFRGLDFRSLHRHHHFGPIFTPAYAYPVAVTVPYASDQYASDEEDEDYTSERPMFDRRLLHSRRDDNLDVPLLAKSADTSQPAEVSVTAQPATVLVFKDGHKVDVENYAIVGDTLFEFSDGLTHKIQLADLDLPATQKVNDDRGVEFHAPLNGAQ